MVDLVNTNRLVPPYGSSYQISFSVPAGGVHAVTVAWTPNAADFPPSLGGVIPGCLFAQVVIPAMYPIPPGQPTTRQATTGIRPIRSAPSTISRSIPKLEFAICTLLAFFFKQPEKGNLHEKATVDVRIRCSSRIVPVSLC
jgi:hypothetical protein